MERVDGEAGALSGVAAAQPRTEGALGDPAARGQQAGTDVSGSASDNSSAVQYWNTFSGAKYGDTNPPAGALAFWGATDANPYGHVAISEGNGHAYSSEERSCTGVHNLTIQYRNDQGYPYLGYVVVG